ncbi:MAG: tetratricopeptide repeat protein [Thiobacillus sp.]|nr:tetratricopeptide repeat protein [Thiobacillus sp.]
MKPISLAHLTFVGVLACVCAQNLLAATANEIYNRSSHNVLLLEGRDAQGKTQGQASATSLGNDVAVTQCDLLSGADNWVVIQDRHVFTAYPRERDEARNLCRLDVPGLRATQLSIVPFEEVRVGQRVYAIGNALGLGLSLSEGLVSGIRDIGNESWIQTTAALAPGSEGGALFDENGRLLGMTDYRKRDGQNINFAAPAAWLPQIVERAGFPNAFGKLQREAANLAQAENWKALSELATGWSHRQPENHEPWLWLGLASEGGQDWPAAVDAYEKSLARMPASVSIALALVRNQLRQNQAEKALDVLHTALDQNRETAGLWFVQGVAEQILGRVDASEKSFRRAVELDPVDALAWEKLFDNAINRHDFQSARQAAAHLTEIGPERPDYWLRLTQAYYSLGLLNRALSTADRAAQIAPDHGDAYVWRGAVLAQLRVYGLAIEALKRGIADKPLSPDWAWEQLANAYYQLKLYPEAIAAQREAIKLAPKQDSYQAELGVMLKDGGQDAEALSLFEALRAKYPDDPFPWRQIGFVQAKTGHYAEAISALEQSLRLAPDQAKVWHALGETYAHADRPDDVHRVYQRLRALDGVHAEQLYRDYVFPLETPP